MSVHFKTGLKDIWDFGLRLCLVSMANVSQRKPPLILVLEKAVPLEKRLGERPEHTKCVTESKHFNENTSTACHRPMGI